MTNQNSTKPATHPLNKRKRHSTTIGFPNGVSREELSRHLGVDRLLVG